ARVASARTGSCVYASRCATTASVTRVSSFSRSPFGVPGICAPTRSYGDLRRESPFQFEDRVDRSGIDVVVEREVARHPVAEVHEVEQLGQAAFTLGLDREHLEHRFLDDLPRDLEPLAQLRVFEAVPELDERHQLAGDVAVLAPRADLVVVE